MNQINNKKNAQFSKKMKKKTNKSLSGSSINWGPIALFPMQHFFIEHLYLVDFSYKKIIP
jgi:hypothetical protein